MTIREAIKILEEKEEYIVGLHGRDNEFGIALHTAIISMKYPLVFNKKQLYEVIKYQIEAYGGKVNPKDDFIGFMNDLQNALQIKKESK